MKTEIYAQNLTKSYPGGVKALRGVGLSVEKGKLFALLGPNGAGKSTLVRILTTLSKPDAGDFLIGGMDPGQDYCRIRKYIGVASQENELDPGVKVEELLQFQARLFGMTKTEANKRTEELINHFQLSSEKNKKAETLSGGNKRRLHCALALVHHPQVLFLDEPTVGMDPVARSTFWSVLSNMNRQENVTILLTTQYLEEADKYASEMALIIEGHIHFSGQTSAFKQMVHPDEHISLEDSYLKYLTTLSQIETNKN